MVNIKTPPLIPISDQAIFQKFLGTCPWTPSISMLCMVTVICTITQDSRSLTTQRAQLILYASSP